MKFAKTDIVKFCDAYRKASGVKHTEFEGTVMPEHEMRRRLSVAKVGTDLKDKGFLAVFGRKHKVNGKFISATQRLFVLKVFPDKTYKTTTLRHGFSHDIDF